MKYLIPLGAGILFLFSAFKSSKTKYKFAWIAGQQLRINKTDVSPIFYAGLQLEGNVGNLRVGDVLKLDSADATELNGKEFQVLQLGDDNGNNADQIVVVNYILEQPGQPRKDGPRGSGEITYLRNEPVKNVNIIPASEWEIMETIPSGEDIPYILNDGGKKIRPLDRYPITKGESFFIDKFFSSILWDDLFDGKGDYLDSEKDKKISQQLLIVSIKVGLIGRRNITDACAFAMTIVTPGLLLASFDLKKPPEEKKKRFFKIMKGIVKGLCSVAALAVNIIPGIGQVASAGIIAGTVLIGKVMDKLPGDDVAANETLDNAIATGRKIYTDVVKQFLNTNESE